MQQQMFRAMGCQMLAVLDAAGPKASAALARVPGWFEAWEQDLSRFRADSALSRLNQSGGRAMGVSAEFWAVLDLALWAEAYSGGLVTPALLGALEAAGYVREFDVLEGRAPASELLPQISELSLAMPEAVMLAAEAAPRPAARQMVVRDAEARTVRLLNGTRLDLGGVAKGWAANEAVRRLAEFGPALVDAGGDIAVSGLRANGEGWLIGVGNPFAPEEDLARLMVSGGGVATSGRDYRRWQQGGVWQHHIIDPRTDRPAETDVVSATVAAPTLSEAEVAAKVSLILGSRAGLAWIEARPQLAGLLVKDDARVLRSSRLQEAADEE